MKPKASHEYSTLMWQAIIKCAGLRQLIFKTVYWMTNETMEGSVLGDLVAEGRQLNETLKATPDKPELAGDYEQDNDGKIDNQTIYGILMAKRAAFASFCFANGKNESRQHLFKKYVCVSVYVVFVC